MQEFCKKEIEFQVIKLSHSCTKMIEVMKENHQELEVTDMTDVQAPERRPRRMMKGGGGGGGCEDEEEETMGGGGGGGAPPMDYEAAVKSKFVAGVSGGMAK